MAVEIEEAAFEAKVLKSPVPVLVDFFATWCGPCVAQGPILEKWASGHEGRVTVVKLNVDNAPNVASQFGIMSIPTLVLFKSGKEVARAVGLQQDKGLDALLAKAGG